MTNRIAIWLFILIVGFFVLDHYVLHLDAPLRHPLEDHRSVGELVAMVEGRRRT